MPANHPSRLKFLDRVSYYGQESELDGQGRIVVPQLLRDSASIVGDVRVFGKIDYLEVWNEERFAQKLAAEVGQAARTLNRNVQAGPVNRHCRPRVHRSPGDIPGTTPDGGTSRPERRS